MLLLSSSETFKVLGHAKDYFQKGFKELRTSESLPLHRISSERATLNPGCNMKRPKQSYVPARLLHLRRRAVQLHPAAFR